jgi:hypothetical protein
MSQGVSAVPRIRTIKPEFWQNEDLASLTHHARLLAIALLNYADDEGCFLANAALVRAACFPFEEDSKNVLGSLQELSKIGYVELRECSGKTIGRVVKFLDHQRIDKAQKSKLVAVFAAGNAVKNQGNASEKSDSTTIPRTFQERSKNVPRLEGNGMEWKGKGKGEGKEANLGIETTLSLSSHGKDQKFQAAWANWIRKQAVKSGRMDAWTEQGQLKELERFSTDDAIAVVEYSTSRTNCTNLITNGDHKRARASPAIDPESGKALGNSIIEKMYGGAT